MQVAVAFACERDGRYGVCELQHSVKINAYQTIKLQHPFLLAWGCCEEQAQPAAAVSEGGHNRGERADLFGRCYRQNPLEFVLWLATSAVITHHVNKDFS